MTLGLLLDRLVTLRPVNGTVTEDRYGNEEVALGVDVLGVPARRHQLDATEDTSNRDEQARTFLYVFKARGAPLTLTGRDRIVDGDDELEVLGAPELVYRRRRAHHVEARARLVSG
jgi:hypothetical protein